MADCISLEKVEKQDNILLLQLQSVQSLSQWNVDIKNMFTLKFWMSKLQPKLDFLEVDDTVCANLDFGIAGVFAVSTYSHNL